MCDLTVKLHACEDMVISQSAFLDKVELAQAAIVAQLTTVQALVAAFSAATVPLLASSVAFFAVVAFCQ